MIKENVKLCKCQPRFMSLSNLLFGSYFIADDKNAYKEIFEMSFYLKNLDQGVNPSKIQLQNQILRVMWQKGFFSNI